MSIEIGVRAHLLADVTFAALGAKIYPRTGLAGIASPYVTYQRISTEPLETLDGPGPGYKGPMGTVDVRAARLFDRDSGFEEETKTHRVRTDFQLTYRS